MKKPIEKINSLKKALDLVGKKHDLLIIDCIYSHNKRAGFNKILKEVKEINPRTLSTRLKFFEENKLITKNIIIGAPIKTEYALTPKAEELIKIINELKKWAQTK